MCFVWISEQTAIISLYSINRLVFINLDGVCLLRGTDWVFIYNSTLCPHSVFMCFVWIWEQTAIISLYSINWLVFITETECVYCAIRTGSSKIIILNFKVWTLQRLNRLRESILHLRIDISKQSHLAQFTSACQHLPLLPLQSAIPYHHNPHYTVRAHSFRSTKALCLHGRAG